MSIPHVYDIDVEYGRCDQVNPRLRRVTANNPSKFSYKGSGTYIVGRGAVAVIDPGPRDEKHIDAIVDAVTGEQVTHILVTHTHGDHSPGAALLKARLGGDIPTYGYGPHPVSAEQEKAWHEANTDPPDPELDKLDEEESKEKQSSHPEMEEGADYAYAPDVVVAHGARITGEGFEFQALHTPGHIGNHLCFALADPHGSIVFTGDHIMGWSTTIVPPLTGNMKAYMSSLQLLLDRDDAVYYPTHGPGITETRRYVEALYAHREQREQQVLAHLAQGPQTIQRMVKTMYATVDKRLWKPAARSVMSQLEKLIEEGRAVCDDATPTIRSTYALA